MIPRQMATLIIHDKGGALPCATGGTAGIVVLLRDRRHCWGKRRDAAVRYFAAGLTTAFFLAALGAFLADLGTAGTDPE